MSDGTLSMQTIPAGSGGFISDLGGILKDTLRETARLVPVWTADQLGLQRTNQLNAPLFNQNLAPPRIDTPARNTAEATVFPPRIKFTAVEVAILAAAAGLVTFAIIKI